MSFGVLGVLKIVPWADVITAAPAVVGGARKLWGALANHAVPSDQQAVGAAGHDTMASLSAKLTAVETEAADLHGQLLAATVIISSLAEQNASVIARMDTTRKQMVWLAAAAAAALLMAMASLAVAFFRT